MRVVDEEEVRRQLTAIVEESILPGLAMPDRRTFLDDIRQQIHAINPLLQFHLSLDEDIVVHILPAFFYN